MAGRDFTVRRTSHGCLTVPVLYVRWTQGIPCLGMRSTQYSSIASTDRNDLCVSRRDTSVTRRRTPHLTRWSCGHVFVCTTRRRRRRWHAAIESSVVAMGGPSHVEANMGGPMTTKHGRVFESIAVRRLLVNPPLTVCI